MKEYIKSGFCGVYVLQLLAQICSVMLVLSMGKGGGVIPVYWNIFNKTMRVNDAVVQSYTHIASWKLKGEKGKSLWPSVLISSTV